MTYDHINPSHYRGDRKFEPIEVIEDWGLNYRLGNALKYISRNGRKPSEDPAEGLKKAIWYLEREIAALDGAKPYKAEYEDVLDYYGQTQDLKEAWPQDLWEDDEYDLYVTGQDGLVGSAGFDSIERPVWDSDDDFMWDPSVGPVELTQSEISMILKSKDLQQFEPDEIVSTVEKRGFVIGVRKDGSTCELGENGRCK